MPEAMAQVLKPVVVPIWSLLFSVYSRTAVSLLS